MIKIGILDDEELIREGIKYKFPFSEYGFEIVYEGDDGNDLIEKIASSVLKIDLFLVDIMMPKLTGIGFIKKTKELVPTSKFIVISGFDEFAFVKEAIKLGVSDYLLKPINPDELHTVLLKERDRILLERKKEHEQFHDQISHHISNKEDIAELSEEARQYLAGFVKEDTAIHVVLLGNLYSTHNFINIRMKIEEALSEEQLLIWMYGIPQFFIMFADKNLLTKLMKLIDYQTVTSITFENIRDLNNLSSLITKAFSLIPSYLTLGEKRSISIKDICISDDSTITNRDEIDRSYTSNLTNLMASNDKKTSINALTFILNQTIPQNKKENAFQLYVWKYHKSNVLLEWLQSFDSPELFFNQCLNLIETLGKDQNSLTGKDILERVTNDMQLEFSTKKTLKDYADSYYIHPNYLARLFKQELGVTFIETLTTIRMEKAKELLKNESITISEISNLVGYEDVRYFSQVFRKYSNLTPSQFRMVEREVTKK
ncbi:response regulator transcription factor [Fredinandcohnia onubensis]|uniref:response regulator transcription factor n=1 Tax=Fredinandcohnia onubensis TaxID=1571209 RepID=UPI000C0BEB6A|nr:helix-turn-helix domain-containing protein [Fredinandcohnia onubensis]